MSNVVWWRKGKLHLYVNQYESMTRAKYEELDLKYLKRQWFCGYVSFPHASLHEEGYGGLLAYAPVHGGITYAAPEGDRMVYGFDAAHAGDGSPGSPTRDLGWMMTETERMAEAIRLARWFEPLYLLLRWLRLRRCQASWIDLYLAALRRCGISQEKWNFGALINLLSGRL